jgi:hypothetical protein
MFFPNTFVTGPGIFPGPIDLPFRTAQVSAAIGDVMELDFTRAYSATDTLPGSSSSVWATLVNPTANGCIASIFACLLQATTATAGTREIKARILGANTPVKILSTTSCTVGRPLYAISGSGRLVSTADSGAPPVLGARLLAQYQDATATPSSVTKLCTFYGTGHGSFAAS